MISNDMARRAKVILCSQVEFMVNVEQHGQIGRPQLRLFRVREHLGGSELPKADDDSPQR